MKALRQVWQYKHQIIIFVLAVLVNANILVNDFVFDDARNIRDNQALRAPDFILTSVLGTNVSYVGPFYRPLIYIIYGFTYRIWNLQPLGFHLNSLIIHGLNAVLVYILFKRIFTRAKINIPQNYVLIGALVFALHPINVESVAPVSSLSEPLYGFFLFLLLVFILDRRFETFGWLVSGVLSVSLILLSILSKETGVLAIPLGLLICWFYERRRLRLFTLAVGVALGGYGLLRYELSQSLTQISSQTSIPGLIPPLSVRLFTAPQVVLYYLTTYLFPLRLAISQQWSVVQPTLTGFVLPLLVVLALIWGAVYIGKKVQHPKPYWLFALWLGGAMLFHLDIFVPLDFTVSDRWFYVAQVGLLGMTLVALERLRQPRVVLLAGYIVLVLLATRTIIRNANYKNDTDLISHDIRISRDSFLLQSKYAEVLYYNLGRHDESALHYEKAIELNPNYFVPYLNLGMYYYFDQHDPEKAISFFKLALDKRKELLVYQDLGAAYLMNKRYDEAIPLLQEGLSLYPADLQLMRLLAIAYLKTRQDDLALQVASYLARGSFQVDDQNLLKAIQEHHDFNVNLFLEPSPR